MGLDHPTTNPSHSRSSERTSRRWDLVRTVLGAIYLLGALAHVWLGLSAPGVYEAFANQALVGPYADLWRSVVVPNLAVLQPLVTLFELGLGLALLWRGRTVKAGHAAGALFQTGLILSGPWGSINAVLAAVHVAALRASYPDSVPALARHWWTARRAHGGQRGHSDAD